MLRLSLCVLGVYAMFLVRLSRLPNPPLTRQSVVGHRPRTSCAISNLTRLILTFFPSLCPIPVHRSLHRPQVSFSALPRHLPKCPQRVVCLSLHSHPTPSLPISFREARPRQSRPQSCEKTKANIRYIPCHSLPPMLPLHHLRRSLRLCLPLLHLLPRHGPRKIL
jgi:hypothetical protein